MDTQAIWLLVLSISTPIAGVVGFAIQLRQVKRTRLENEKLQLEVAALRAAALASESRIVQPTNEEVLRITGRPLFSIADPDRTDKPIRPLGPAPRERITEAAIVLAFFLVVLYFLYDLYRLAKWIWSEL